MSYRAGFVGMVGLPNAGKSSLLNALVGEKVSIVTSKPQTTRRRVMGLLTDENAQMVIIDAPGVIRAKAGLNQFLEAEARDVITQSDVLILVLNIDESNIENFATLVEIVKTSRKPFVIFINKIDLPVAHRAMILKDRFGGFGAPVLTGSALRSNPEGLEELKSAVREFLPESRGPLYDSEYWTLSPVRDLALELVREKCFERLHQEIPFSLGVRLLKYDDSSKGLVRIFCEILVGKENHKAIVVGRGGQTLKEIGKDARLEIEKLVDRKVYLDIKVIAKRNWMRMHKIMKEMGYVVPNA